MDGETLVNELKDVYGRKLFIYKKRLGFVSGFISRDGVGDYYIIRDLEGYEKSGWLNSYNEAERTALLMLKTS